MLIKAAFISSKKYSETVILWTYIFKNVIYSCDGNAELIIYLCADLMIKKLFLLSQLKTDLYILKKTYFCENRGTYIYDSLLSGSKAQRNTRHLYIYIYK